MVVTLLTDFGTEDYFVGAMKGALLSVNPAAQVVDITHEIPAHDIAAGAFTLLAAFESFPAGSIHVAVVDPGVGSSRRAIAVEGGGHLFVGPDNGIFGFIYERLVDFQVYQLTNARYFRPSVSSTFHGRDVFAPVAGALTLGVPARELGTSITDFVRLDVPLTPARQPDGSLAAAILHIDRFGNIVTNITARDLPPEECEQGVQLVVGEHTIRRFRRFFAEAEGARGEPFAIWGSAGFLEIAIFLDSAARRLDARAGQSIVVTNPEY